VRFLDTPDAITPIGSLQAAVRAARSSLIHVLLPGTLVESDWCEEAIDRLWRDLRIASVAPQVVVNGSPQPVIGVSLGVGGARLVLRDNQNSRQAWGPTLGAGFYRRSALQAIGGWDPILSHAADVDLAIRLAEKGFGCVASAARVTSSSATWFHSPYQVAFDSEVCFWRHLHSSATSMSLAGHGLTCVSRWLRQLVHPWTCLSDWAGMASAWTTSTRFTPSVEGDEDMPADDEQILPYSAQQTAADKKSHSRRRSA